MHDNYSILIGKLDEFIRKYYKNQLIRGGIYSVAVLLLFYLSVNLLEYFARFGISARTALFYVYIAANLLILWRLILLPLLKLNKIGTVISNEYASEIIGRHFPEIKDKLLNTLQLKQLDDNNSGNMELIKASINQKISQLKPVPFTYAIDFTQNKRYLKYAVPPLLLLIVILFAAPSIITEPTTRLIKHNKYFEELAPFSFHIQNKSLQAIQQEDFQLDVKLTGEEIPDNVFIKIEDIQYKLEKENTVKFHHIFKNVQKTLTFQLFAENYTSREYELKVLPKPIVLNFEIALDYPKYINKKNEVLENTGDLIIPCGTKVNWKFFTKDTRNIILRFKEGKQAIEKKSSNAFTYAKAFCSNQSYSIAALNEFLVNKDSLNFVISVIPDAYPSIQIEEYKDSIYEKNYYFKGMIKDDYGFSRLTFNYKKLNEDTSGKSTGDILQSIPINRTTNQQSFYHQFNMSSLAINPGDEIEYYFEVWDNDGVNGSKSTRSQKMIFKAPTRKEIEEQTEKTNEQIKEDIEQTIKDAKDLQKQTEDLNKKLLDKKNLSWQEKKQIQELLNKQKELQKNIENIQKQNEHKNLQEQQYSQSNEEIQKKQEQLNKLFEEIMTDEMKELFKKLEELLNQLDKDKMKNMLDQMKYENKDIEKQLDRTLEIFKQLEFEQKLNETIERLKELSQQEEKLSEESKKKESDNKDLIDNQKQLNKDFQDIKQNLDQLDQKNKELENPNKFENTDKEQEAIKKEMDNSLDLLNENKNKKASESQKNASEQMKNLSEKLQQMQEEMEQEGIAEDIDALRDILENLVQISFDQENLINKTTSVSKNDPKYIETIQQQKNLKDDLKMIEDSLFALSKRQIQIKSFVNKEILDINQNMEKVINALEDRNTSLAASKEQFIMTSINNLALLLAESLESLQQQMMQQNSSKSKSCKKGNCSKPGNGKPSSVKSLRQLQQQLNKQIEQLQKGNKPNGQGMGQMMSEQLARLAAQQEAIRRQLQELSNELKNDGKGNKANLDKIIQEMDKTETDLVNKVITQETLKRQQEILTRLLQSEKAEMERELDEKRESNEAKNQNYSNPNEFFEYKRLKENEEELLKTTFPTLNSFYKRKVNEYFYNFGD